MLAKDLTDQEFLYGHKACTGCALGIVGRLTMKVLGEKTVVTLPASCMSTVTTQYPQMNYTVPSLTMSFPASGAFVSGMAAGFKAQGIEDVNVVVFAGDGGTADIGLQSLSGAVEQGQNFIYICYDNEAYMNTGIQRSSSTPHFADTTTTPAGTVIPGKLQQKKNLTKIMVAHNVPYVAQTTFLGNFKDITEKAHKAIYTPGAAFLNVMAPCPRGWRYPSEKLMEVTKAAVETCVWPLYEVIEGKYVLSYQPKNKLPVEEYLKLQGRFAHMFKPGNEWMIEQVQQEVDRNWEELLKLCSL